MARESRFGLFLAAVMILSAAVAASAGPRDSHPAAKPPAHHAVLGR
jgi:hypothetical protein